MMTIMSVKPERRSRIYGRCCVLYDVLTVRFLFPSFSPILWIRLVFVCQLQSHRSTCQFLLCTKHTLQLTFLLKRPYRLISTVNVALWTFPFCLHSQRNFLFCRTAWIHFLEITIIDFEMTAIDRFAWFLSLSLSLFLDSLSSYWQ